jgi:hypothetical protein
LFNIFLTLLFLENIHTKINLLRIGLTPGENLRQSIFTPGPMPQISTVRALTATPASDLALASLGGDLQGLSLTHAPVSAIARARAIQSPAAQATFLRYNKFLQFQNFAFDLTFSPKIKILTSLPSIECCSLASTFSLAPKFSNCTNPNPKKKFQKNNFTSGFIGLVIQNDFRFFYRAKLLEIVH